ncbi:MAG: tRNA epoxyqueuosine(34) reductase QueG [Gemmatimonadota bacterium]|jgi:epoxyqueuosine reductase|nr:tRNA epoxyqueuosine(34) reductase QueG [Gemmatimonadota bacterium]MDP7032559.1 tRNA epoxyqueuosine(34) reductase QueG [Gemmatimonadota bacterium]
MKRDERRDAVAREAEALGFARAGFAPAEPCRDRDRLEAWLADGFHAEMQWIARRVDRRTDPTVLLPGAKTVISLLTRYLPPPGAGAASPVGRVSRYARGRDYHNVIARRMKKLARAVKAADPESVTRALVDSGPVLEKEWAERAGLGWIGKHTNLVTESEGSWFFVSELVTTADLAPSGPGHDNRCERCIACIRACPTGAIVAPYRVDARRCISYLTIELRGAIPRELRPLVGDWIFGCDLCQEVCPWNRFAVETSDPAFAAGDRRFPEDIAGLLSLTEEEFRRRFSGSPIRRAGRDGLLRNACVALGNLGDASTLPALERALRDRAALVRAHAAWAIGRIGGTGCRILAEASESEEDAEVRREITFAIGECRGEAVAPPPPAE